MAELIYGLCALTSLGCVALQFRGYRATRSQLLLYSTICFVGLTLNNILLFIDTFVVMDMNLSTVRLLPAVLGLGFLVYGLVKTGD